MNYSGKNPLNRREPDSKEMPAVARPLEHARGPESGRFIERQSGAFGRVEDNRAFHVTRDE